MSIEEIDWSCPADLRAYEKAYKLQMKQNDSQMYMMGMYVMSAVTTSVEHCLAGKKAKSSYMEKPLLSDVSLESKKEIPEEKRIEMENHKLAMSLLVMQANFEINKEKKKRLE